MYENNSLFWEDTIVKQTKHNSARGVHCPVLFLKK